MWWDDLLSLEWVNFRVMATRLSIVRVGAFEFTMFLPLRWLVLIMEGRIVPMGVLSTRSAVPMPPMPLSHINIGHELLVLWWLVRSARPHLYALADVGAVYIRTVPFFDNHGVLLRLLMILVFLSIIILPSIVNLFWILLHLPSMEHVWACCVLPSLIRV